ncbi:MAG: TIM barrel protein [Trueperaceae bacterium]|nr:TIM barrel protein [Trueperaceae bacterium]
MSAPWPLSAHLGYLFTEVPLERRLAAAAAAGFDAVEHPAPFEVPASRMATLLREAGLFLAQVTTGRGPEGEKGLASLPGREREVRDALARALDYAEAVACPYVHLMAGCPGADVPHQQAADTWLANVAAAIHACRDRPVEVLVEPISHATVPGYFLDRLTRLDELLPQLPKAPHVLLDTHHASANAEDAPAAIARASWRLGHVHVADHPGRHEPGTGTIDFEALLGALARTGYDGAIGFEYLPTAETEGGLDWLPAWRAMMARHAGPTCEGGTGADAAEPGKEEP